LPAGSADEVQAFGAPAAPGATVTYGWLVPEDAAPGPGEPDTKLWIYRSTLEFEAHADAGLVGPILVSRPDSGAGTDWDEQRDIITFFQIIKEGASPYNELNLGNRTLEELDLADEAELEESGLKHAVNGYVYCNLPGIDLVQGTKYVLCAAVAVTSACPVVGKMEHPGFFCVLLTHSHVW
jgi:hypothetical protein